MLSADTQQRTRCQAACSAMFTELTAKLKCPQRQHSFECTPPPPTATAALLNLGVMAASTCGEVQAATDFGGRAAPMDVSAARAGS